MRTLLFLLFLAGPAAHAQMYKCVDAKGVTHYSDKPGTGCQGAAVDIRGQPPISGRLQERRDDAGDAEREFQRRQIERGREAEHEAKQAEVKRRNCATMRSQLDMLEKYGRISKIGDKGERVYMDDATRDARMAQLRTQLARCPS